VEVVDDDVIAMGTHDGDTTSHSGRRKRTKEERQKRKIKGKQRRGVLCNTKTVKSISL